MPNYGDVRRAHKFLNKNEIQNLVNKAKAEITAIETAGDYNNFFTVFASVVGFAIGGVWGLVAGTSSLVLSIGLGATRDMHIAQKTELEKAWQTLNLNSKLSAVRITVEYEYKNLRGKDSIPREGWVPKRLPFVSGYRYTDGTEIIDQ